MDAAAREMKHRSGRAAPAQPDPPGADALHERDGPDLRQRHVREDPRPGPRARRLERLRRAPRRSRSSAASCAAAASRPSSNGPAATPSRSASRSTSRPTASSRSTRRRSRWARASRPATRSSPSTCSACRSRRSASCRATPIAATASAAPARARSSPAARRCSVAAERTVDHAKGSSPPRRSRRPPPTSSTATAASRSPAPISASTCSSSPASSPSERILVDATSDGRRAELAERLPHLRGRDRSRHRRRRDRLLRLGQRHRPGGEPDDRARPARRRRGAGHRPGAVRADRLRPGSRPAASPRASWTTRCRAPTSCRDFRTEFDTSMPCLTNPLGVKGVGELGTIGATPAVVNAVVDALAHAGARPRRRAAADAADARSASGRRCRPGPSRQRPASTGLQQPMDRRSFLGCAGLALTGCATSLGRGAARCRPGAARAFASSRTPACTAACRIT